MIARLHSSVCGVILLFGRGKLVSNHKKGDAEDICLSSIAFSIPE